MEPIQQNNNMEKFTEKQVYELMIKAFNAGFNKYESVEAGLEGKEADLECANILAKYVKTPIHKFNSGMGATLCNVCSIIIAEGMTDDLFCEKHKNMRWRKKPVEIEALQWTGQNHREMFNFLGGEDTEYMTAAGVNFYIDFNKVEGGLVIKTLEGEHIATIGDYIIKGVKGEYYPCKEDVFYLTYERAS